MNCKWAEGYLSACLDGTLDPAVRDEVVAHVGVCSHCSSILEDYRHFDGLVRDLPRYEPAPDLRDRLFNSPEFAAIVRSREEREEGAGERHPATVRPFLLSRPLGKGRGGPAAHDRALTPIPFTRRDGNAGETPAAAEAEEAGTHTERTGPPAWARTAVAAALVVVVVGSALLFWQGHLHPGKTTSPGTISNIGGYHGGTPLAAGVRVVYAHDGALWSAHEQGTSVAQRLTPPNVVVGSGWAVAPLNGRAGGELVAYVDLKTGALHVVRSDDQRDHTVGHSLVPAASASAAFWATPEGQAILGSLTWSPDGTFIAALADVTGTGRLSLVVLAADGSAERSVSGAVAAGVAPVWSADSVRLAFAQADGTAQSVWDYNVAADQVKQVSVAAPDGPASAVVRATGWLSSQGDPVLTWAAADPASGAITGVYAQSVLRDGVALRLTPSGTDYIVAAYASTQDGGLWLLGDGASLSSVSAPAGVVTQIAAVDGGMRAITWSSDGAMAAVLSGSGALSVWSASAGLTPLGDGVAAQPSAAWSADGQHLAFVANGRVMIVRMQAGAAGTPSVVAGVSGATALAWAPDGQQLAVATSAGVALASADGVTLRQVDTKSATGGLMWSAVR